jgi:two-component system chemotaxis sensor kinase CheA
MGFNDKFEILFIDDETDITQSYLDNFNREGFKTVVFSEPRKAVEYINENFSKIILVFTDQNMPECSGTNLVDMLNPEAKEIPVVMVSGYLDVDLIEEANKSGIKESLPKPLAHDMLEKLIEKHAKGREEVLIEEKEMIQHFLEETEPLIIEIEEIILDLDNGDDVENRLKDYFRILHTIKGTGACLGLKDISAYVHKYEDFVGEIRDGNRQLGPGVNALLLRAYDMLKDIFNYIKENGTDRTLDTGPFTKSLESSVKELDQSEVDENGSVSAGQSKAPAAVTASGEGKGVGKKEAMSVSLSLLDEFNELSGEVTVLRNSIMKSFKGIETRLPNDPEVLLMGEMLEGMHKVIGSLQSKITEMRKIPLKNVFRQFKRVVRDVSKSTGKNAELHIEGDELRVDNQVGNILSNTMVHLIRNSVDHGLEDKAGRKEAGKEEKGIVSILATDCGEYLQVLVKDDGRGISREKIQAIAIERGMGTAEEFASYSDSRIFGLIFESGFSTAEVVTDISGRGVGMDMVKSSIEKAGGEIRVDSELGRGSTITLKIPYPKSVLIINSVLVSASGGSYLIPADDVVEVVCLEEKFKSRIEMINDRYYYRQNERIYPILTFDHVLGKFDSDYKIEEQDSVSLCKVKVGSFEYFIVVDEVLDLEEIVKKPLTYSVYEKAFAFCGASVLGNGDVSLILDVERIMENYLNQSIKDAQAKEAEDEMEKVASNVVEYLGVDCGFGENLLFELKDVFRLEKIKPADIQYSSGRQLIKYRGEPVPILFLDGYLGTERFDQELLLAAEKELDAVMIKHNDRLYCIVVGSIKDILKSGEEISGDIVSDNRLLGVFYIEETIFNVLNIHSIVNTMGSKNKSIDFVA